MDEPENTHKGGEHQRIAATIREAIAARGLSQAEVARQSDMSDAVLSQFLSGTYRGNRDEAARKLAAWHRNLVGGEDLAAIAERVAAFAPTPVSGRIEAVLRIAKSGNMVMITGGSGVGKSKTLKHFRDTNPAVWYAEFSKDTKSVYSVLAEIGKAIGITSLATRPDQARREIVGRMERTRGLLICDEAQHLTDGGLEVVRTIHDRAEIGVALAGHLDLAENTARLAQVEGRIFAPLRIATASPEDADALFASWGLECKRSREFLRAMANRATGLRGIRNVYRLAAMYATAESTPVSLSHVTIAWTELNRPAQAA